MKDNWSVFAGDWNPSVFDISKLTNSHCNFYQCQTIVALLEAQQESAAQMKSKGGHSACKQFVADIKTGSWHPASTSIRFTERATGFDYDYMAQERVCFRGNLIYIRELSSGSVISTARHKIDRNLVAYKLDQFKGMFPSLTHLWIFLDALTIAHFYSHSCYTNDANSKRADPLLKHHKVLFDQGAIDKAFENYSVISELEYTVHKLSVGRYSSYSLTLYASDLILMNVSLGIHQDISKVVDVDILIG